MNYMGPNHGQGIGMFIDGAEVASDTIKETGSTPAPLQLDGRIVVGRRYTNRDKDYASVQVDELIYFNQALTDEEIRSIYNSTKW